MNIRIIYCIDDYAIMGCGPCPHSYTLMIRPIGRSGVSQLPANPLTGINRDTCHTVDPTNIQILGQRG
jgi:hypothetical protein